MSLLQVLPAVLIGYVLGSIPVGYLVGKAYGVDVLKTESGRTGATNLWRATGQTSPLVLTVLGDILKGMLAVWIGRYVFNSELAAALAGAAAVMGHNWSFMLGWRGGAGGITTGAALLALSPLAGAIMIPIALLALYISHYASVGTLTIALGGLAALSIIAVLAPSDATIYHVLFGLFSSAAVTVALRPNLKRLAEGKERRITLW
jgi:acyl phosphate:glycerol-3-phosphate acyltransferase